MSGLGQIGPYHLLQVLGEGGMGVVYDAEQREPVRRRVAVKVLKLGMDTHAFVARFEAERQALAVMDHPGIARVLDAGATPEGRPFFVMERVQGVPITTYCDDGRLTTRDRILLLVHVCQAVQHAHLKGVIHRDLKPSNVLVTEQDDRPLPKVIDFGIAKVLVGRLTEKTLVTEFGQPLGTPAYMSPEQWGTGESDIDTRADVYSLGVMLYELLVGRLPRDRDALLRAGPGAPMLLRDTAPTAPSSRIRDLGDESNGLARARRTVPATLERELRGDLDWITLKAMDPDRRRRYETVQALAADLERHLHREPVLARPPSVRYRMGRFVSRHRPGVTVAAAMVVLVVGFAALSTMQAARVARERDRAEYEAAKARALNDFLQEALLAPDPIEGLGRDATVLQALDSAAARLSRERLVSPAVEASVRSAIGWAYFRLGLYDQSEPLLQAALAQSRTLPRADQSELAQNILRVAQLEARLARHAAAFPLFAEGLALTERVHGDRARQVGAALVPLGELQQSRGDTAAALASLGRAAAIFRERGDSAGLATVDSHLGILEYGRGNLQAAERHFRASLDYRRRLGDHPLVAEALVNLGALLEDLRRPADAEAMYREGLAIGTRALGDDHDMVTATLNNLGLLLGNQGRRFEAEELLRRALAADERKLGPDHPAVAVDLGNLARVACTEPPSADGLSLAERAVRLQTMHAGAEAWETGQARVFVGQCHAVGRRFDDAERELRAGLRLIESALGTGHWRADSARARLAQLDRLRRRAGITR